jgi:hypothetical protein
LVDVLPQLDELDDLGNEADQRHEREHGVTR